ncbi:MAG: winged helix-turn-helix transcriptional regulator, partial [Cyanothece sp. SIO1E1]|nr:winged helix-turn-helix transcriptional regulator [Cyanothece sp. SIO1E1]
MDEKRRRCCHQPPLYNIYRTRPTITFHDASLELTLKEYELLLFFVTNKNRVLTKQAIAEHLWGDNVD